jgi:hypothetical protein
MSKTGTESPTSTPIPGDPVTQTPTPALEIPEGVNHSEVRTYASLSSEAQEAFIRALNDQQVVIESGSTLNAFEKSKFVYAAGE